jgi:hypothetical protein
MMQPEHLTLVPWRETDWRSLQILDFNRYSVRRLQQTIGTQPIVTLKALPRSAEWTAETAGADATAFISREVIEKMINRLGTFNVNHWVAGLQEGHDALLAPSLEIELDVEYANDRSALDKPSTKTIHLTFAPAGDPKTALYYYGRCTDYADYFRITREIYNELAAPVLKK